ncbi:hypothetical protein [Bifidobacterium sp. ESL0800]|uniref:glucuronyl esterase domain-containing protein n=1 Tax=Bifidobacterium sp. ESL0800 TaxID=2983236 RepID=UPI0023F7944E|nr:hypothetical protein [Bifidobacterium sp. ESL0800]WEV75201.1 hypothetical protein OZX75_06045 [Bifidobacterium sp. ESL0800]
MTDYIGLMPDALMTPDGKRVGTTAQWPRQRQLLLDLLSRCFYGTMPEPPKEIHEGTVPVPAAMRAALLSCSESTDASCFHLTMGPDDMVRIDVVVAYDKAAGAKPVPVLVPCPSSLFSLQSSSVDDLKVLVEGVLRVGACFVGVCTDISAPDDSSKFDSCILRRAYPDCSWRMLAMWAWQISRVIDWISRYDQFDVRHPVALGHSRYGKAVLCAAAFDDRIVAAAPCASGIGGMGALRFDGNRFGVGCGDKHEHIEDMLSLRKFPHWLLPSAVGFGRRRFENADQSLMKRLGPWLMQPVCEDSDRSYPSAFDPSQVFIDANLIGACVAPRPLFLAEALDDEFCSMFGTQLAWEATADVYRFLGVPQRCAIHYREGGHALTERDLATSLCFMLNRHDGNSASDWHDAVRGNCLS